MITILEALVEGADGSYASKQDLRNLEHVMFSWAERKEAYLAVQAKEKSILDRAMILIQTSKNLSENLSIDEARVDRCRRDITLMLRSYALGMLLQDEEMLKERFLYWQKNVLRAMGLHHYQGAKFVLESLYIELPKEQAELFEPYFKLGQELMMSN
jgi:nucleotidyltransferase/DNA polymerase involved in DNA repair